MFYKHLLLGWRRNYMKMITTRTLTISQYVTNMEFNEDIKSSIG